MVLDHIFEHRHLFKELGVSGSNAHIIKDIIFIMLYVTGCFDA